MFFFYKTNEIGIHLIRSWVQKCASCTSEAHFNTLLKMLTNSASNWLQEVFVTSSVIIAGPQTVQKWFWCFVLRDKVVIPAFFCACEWILEEVIGYRNQLCWWSRGRQCITSSKNITNQEAETIGGDIGPELWCTNSQPSAQPLSHYYSSPVTVWGSQTLNAFGPWHLVRENVICIRHNPIRL